MSGLNAHKFEREVADLYRSLGAQVRHDVSVAGNQIDLVVIETTSSGSTITRVVECKAYAAPVGIEPIRSFAALARLLRERNLADAATLVSANGFSRFARDAASEFGIELQEIADLRARVAKPRTTPALELPPVTADTPPDTPTASRIVFVAQPFNPDFDDVFLFGISSAAESAGISTERADDNLESVEIINDIRARIEKCDLLIANTTEPNPNVYYELGFADGLKKRVLLIAKAGVALPFDLQGRRHLLYKNIGELKSSLEEYFKTL